MTVLRIGSFAITISLLALAACGGDPSAPDKPLEPRIGMARSPGDVVVSSVKPDSAQRDTTLDVTINGSGFVAGSSAAWALAGSADPAQVRTNSTRYVSSRQVVANITISSTATLAKWDVIVMAGPKTGIGTELFEIKQTGNVDTGSRALLTWDSEVNVAAPGASPVMAPAGIRGDGRDRFGIASAVSEYQGEFCGVDAKIFWNSADFSGSGDLTFDPDMSYSADMKGCGTRRMLLFHLSYVAGGSPGPASAIGAWSNARQVIQLSSLGDSRSQFLRFWYMKLRNCDRIDFDSVWGNGAANVRVTRLANLADGAKVWRVESEYPHLGMCTTFGGNTTTARGTKYLPFGFTATEVPYPYQVYR